MLLAFNKPYRVLSRFTPDGSPNRTLQDFGFPKNVYPVGRLDDDSEGLLLLSDEPEWNSRLLERGYDREYWVQVERIPPLAALESLELGVLIQGRKTLPCKVSILDPQPTIPPRDPPVRYRKTVSDCWICMVLREGKNRQVRRMTASVGHPTLRLIRVRIGDSRLGDLAMGQWRRIGRVIVSACRRADVERGTTTPTRNPVQFLSTKLRCQVQASPLKQAPLFVDLRLSGERLLRLSALRIQQPRLRRPPAWLRSARLRLCLTIPDPPKTEWRLSWQVLQDLCREGSAGMPEACQQTVSDS